MKSGNLNFLETSGPLQACNGTALPLPLPLYVKCTLLVVLYGEIRVLDNNVRNAESFEGVCSFSNACDLIRLRRVIHT
jgi:hypothetical protein